MEMEGCRELFGVHVFLLLFGIAWKKKIICLRRQNAS